MAETKPAQAAQNAEAPAADSGTASPSKKKKINGLTLAEIDAKLAQCREKQGGLESKYAQRLLLRKKSLGS